MGFPGGQEVAHDHDDVPPALDILLALLLAGLPEMLQRLARMLVLFFQGLAMAFFGREALLQVDHLLGELRVFQGLAA